MRKRAIVAIVGRPNVGKSTLFNRLVERRDAVVHDLPGVTRDRHTGIVTWNTRSFDLVDTGGLLPRAREGMEQLVRDAALAAVEEADLVMLVVDATTGVTDLDLEVARLLQRGGKPVLLAVNKVDGPTQEPLVHEFHRLGLGEPLGVSAAHGLGRAALLDAVAARLPEELPGRPERDADLRVAILGKPNVGKSSLLNSLLGEDRVLVSEVPGTTRDPIDTRLRWHGHEIDLVDTAGLRKRSRLKEAVDVFASVRTLHSLERCDVCVLVLDATEPVSQQDTRIAGYAHKAGKGIVACFNKWDAVDKDTRTVERFREEFDRHFRFARYAPLLFVSALRHQRIHKILETAWQVGETRRRTLRTADINRVLERAFQRNPPHYYQGGNGQVKYGLQVGVEPPRIAIYVNNPEFFDRNYLRYLNNALRDAFGFPGTVLRIELRASPGRGEHAREAG